MNDKELEKYILEMKKHREELLKDKEKSLNFLVKAGICTEKGNLNKWYRG